MVKRRFAFVPFFLAAMFRPFLLSMAILSHTRGIPPSGLRIAPTCALSHSYAMGSRSTGDAGGQDDLATPDSGRARRDGNDWDGTAPGAIRLSRTSRQDHRPDRRWRQLRPRWALSRRRPIETVRAILLCREQAGR